MSLLVTSREEMTERGIDRLDFILISGDAYVDHPMFAAALIGRFLQAHGFSVGVIAQPDWRTRDDFLQLGSPRLAFGVTAGNIDSMVAHYTAEKRRRRRDELSPGGRAGLRPDRATIVYTNRLRETFPGVPIIIGGVEASLRRIAHYDYWDDRVRRSILLDSRADLLIYGSGEYPLLRVLGRLQSGEDICSIRDERGTGYVSGQIPQGKDLRTLPSYEEVAASKQAFNEMTTAVIEENDPYTGRILAQKHAERWVVLNPPSFPLTSQELDFIYEQPFTRAYHPAYEAAGGVPGLKPVQFSLVSHRGCFGGCHFCSLALHQGKYIQSRSIDSLVREARSFTTHPDFKGTIQDVGGPSANMYGLSGKKTTACQACHRTSCLAPEVCRNMRTDENPSLELLRALREIPGVKHVFVASGVRYDLVMADPSPTYLEELTRYHVSGQMKIAPEHVVDKVTAAMGKPPRHVYDKFAQAFGDASRRAGKKQYLIPYFIAAHPGCDLKDMLELALFVRDHLQYFPEQVQLFTPTPMTVSTAMYYTGMDPFTGRRVKVARSEKERRMQRALLQYRDPRGKDLVLEALQRLGRTDLIGRRPGCLVAPDDRGNGRQARSRQSKKRSDR